MFRFHDNVQKAILMSSQEIRIICEKTRANATLVLNGALLSPVSYVPKISVNIIPIQIICNTRAGMHHPENNGLSRRSQITRDPLIEGHDFSTV